MLDARVLSLLPKIPPPILTVYLDTNPANPRNQRWPSRARIWLKAQAQTIRANMAREEEKVFRKQAERVERFLAKRPKRERGIAIYAGPRAWHVLRLQVQVDDELYWGRASSSNSCGCWMSTSLAGWRSWTGRAHASIGFGWARSRN